MEPSPIARIRKLVAKHWFELFILGSLSVLPFYFLTPDLFIFQSVKFPFFGGTTYYGGFVYITLVFGLVLWFGLRRNKGTSRGELLSRLGFEQNLSKIGAGLLIGCVAGAIMWYSQKQAIESLMSIFSSDSLLFLNMTTSAILGAPIVEEVLFRGYLINKLSRFKEKPLKTGALAVLSSIFLFAFIHLHAPTDKLISGAVFTLVYVWGWRKNLVAAIAAHSAANSTTIFLGYIQAGPIAALGTLPLIIALISALILILMNVNRVLKFAERICSIWLRFVDFTVNQFK